MTFCSICSDPTERITKPNVVLVDSSMTPDESSLTCVELEEKLAVDKTGNICPLLGDDVSSLCGCSQERSCQLCGDDDDNPSFLLFPSKTIPWDLIPTDVFITSAAAAAAAGIAQETTSFDDDDAISCQDLQSLLEQAPTVYRYDSVCSISQAFFADYCGCSNDGIASSNSVAIQRCSICQTDDEVETTHGSSESAASSSTFNSSKRIDSLLPVPSWIETCGELETAVDLFFSKESEQCSDVQRIFSTFCECNNNNDGNVVEGNPCTLCGTSNRETNSMTTTTTTTTTTSPNKVVPFVEALLAFPNVTCGLYEAGLLSHSQDDEQCDLVRSDNDNGYVLKAFCGCSDTSSTTMATTGEEEAASCIFCESGSMPEEFSSHVVSFLDADHAEALEAMGIRPTCQYVDIWLRISSNMTASTCDKFQSYSSQCGCNVDEYVDDGMLWLYGGDGESLNETLARATVWVPRTSGILSLLGALCILWDILTCAERRKRVYCQLVTGMAIFDASSAIPWILSTLAVPVWLDDDETTGVYGARGNDATCQAQAFFVQLGFATFLWNVSISTYYLLVIVYNWKERRLRRVKPWLVSCPILLAVIIACAALPFYDWNPFVCHFAYFDHNDYTGSLTSDKKNNLGVLYGFVFAPILTCLIILTILVLTIYLSVRKKSRKSVRYSYNTRKTSIEFKVFVQCFCYLAAFLLTWPAILLAFLVTTTTRTTTGSDPGLILALVLLGPLQGFANSIVYFRPRLVPRCCLLLGLKGGGTNSRPLSDEELQESKRNKLKELLRRHEQGQLAFTPPTSIGTGGSSNQVVKDAEDAAAAGAIVANSHDEHKSPEREPMAHTPDSGMGGADDDVDNMPSTPMKPSKFDLGIPYEQGISDDDDELGPMPEIKKTPLFPRLSFVAAGLRGRNSSSLDGSSSASNRRTRVSSHFGGDLDDVEAIPEEDGEQPTAAPPSLYRNDVSYQDPSLFIANEEDMWNDDDEDESALLPPVLNRVISAGVAAMPTRLFRGFTAGGTPRRSKSCVSEEDEEEIVDGAVSSLAGGATMATTTSMVANRGSTGNETLLGFPDPQQQQALMFGMPPSSTGTSPSPWGGLMMGGGGGMMSDESSSSSDDFLPSTVRPIGRMVDSNSPGAPKSRKKLVTYKEMAENGGGGSESSLLSGDVVHMLESDSFNLSEIFNGSTTTRTRLNHHQDNHSDRRIPVNNDDTTTTERSDEGNGANNATTENESNDDDDDATRGVVDEVSENRSMEHDDIVIPHSDAAHDMNATNVFQRQQQQQQQHPSDESTFESRRSATEDHSPLHGSDEEEVDGGPTL